MADVLPVIESIQYLISETEVNRKTKDKLQSVVDLLASEAELSVEKAILVLEEVDDDFMIQAEIWDLISQLEMLNQYFCLEQVVFRACLVSLLRASIFVYQTLFLDV